MLPCREGTGTRKGKTDREIDRHHDQSFLIFLLCENEVDEFIVFPCRIMNGRVFKRIEDDSCQQRQSNEKKRKETKTFVTKNFCKAGFREDQIQYPTRTAKKDKNRMK